MKKLIFLITILCSLTASAEDYTLYYDLTSGAKQTIVAKVAELKKIEFDHKGGMKVYKANGTIETIDISQCERIYFSSESTDIISVGMDDNVTARPVIYDIMGRPITLEYKDLPRGIYIINGEKIQVK